MVPIQSSSDVHSSHLISPFYYPMTRRLVVVNTSPAIQPKKAGVKFEVISVISIHRTFAFGPLFEQHYIQTIP